MKKSCIVAVALILGIAGQGMAGSIAITNPSFESPATLTTSGSVTGWTIGGSGGAGVWNINADPAGFWTVPAPDGNQIAFVSNAPHPGSFASISQTLGDILQTNTTYDLTGYVGHPLGFGGSVGTAYTAELLAGTNVLASVTGTGPEATFAAFDVTYNSAGSPFIGQPLTIELSSSQAQTGFDDIHLAATPEPGTLTLFGIGIVSMAAYGWRRQKRAVSC